MSKQSNIPISGLYRYECHLEKIIAQAQQSLHLKRATSASFNQTQKIAVKEHAQPTLTKNRNKLEPRSRQTIKMSNVSHPNHRKMSSSISKPKDKTAPVHTMKTAKQKCKSAFIQSPNRKASINKSTISEENGIRAASVDIKTKEEELTEKAESYELLIQLMKSNINVKQKETNSFSNCKGKKLKLMKMQSLVSKECEKVQEYSKKIKDCSKVLLEQIEKIHSHAADEKKLINSQIQSVKEEIERIKIYSEEGMSKFESLLKSTNEARYKMLTIPVKKSPKKKQKAKSPIIYK